MSKKELKVKLELSLEQAVQHLEKLVNSLKEKKVVITKEDQYIVLEPMETLKLKLNAKEEKNGQVLKIEINWSNIQPVDESAGTVFSISSNEPVVKEEETQTTQPTISEDNTAQAPEKKTEPVSVSKQSAKGNLKK